MFSYKSEDKNLSLICLLITQNKRFAIKIIAISLIELFVKKMSECVLQCTCFYSSLLFVFIMY